MLTINDPSPAPLGPTGAFPAMLGGFQYWLLFLLSLEPGNIARDLKAGVSLVWSQEAMRISGASLLGCAITPLLLEQVRRFPVEGKSWRRHAVLQCLGSLVVAAALIAISCVLADWFLAAEKRPLGLALIEELATNGPLVAFCVATFIALAHAMRFFEQIRQGRAQPIEPSASYVTSLLVRQRGRVILLDVDRIDWIETQGNYLALHAGSEAHLIRDSLSRLEPRLDPRRFLRVHRRIVVAADRVATIVSLGAGDARLGLTDGTELRLSRTYRDRIDTVLAGSSGREASV
jgi:hypothetical protein